ncbi:hypothetical protein LTR08_007075 [Meristemomyces frigidus]|nr:hypothetical protein LTR08_007075 [Meristemomyces frigidus]
MSNFTARRAPNVSRYLANLNTIPSAHELNAADEFPLGDDGLDFLTNTEFFDFDNFNNGDVGGLQAMGPQVQQSPHGLSHKGPGGQQYQFGEFQTYPTMSASGSLPATPPNGLQGAYPPQAGHFPLLPQANTGDKRSASVAGLSISGDLDEDSRMAAEEDKRRRNTAASARFRVKKKQRESALETQTKELSAKVHQLESKVSQLETENKWLKELITEKSTGEPSVETNVFEKVTGKEGAERSTDSRTDGVGTKETKAEA